MKYDMWRDICGNKQIIVYGAGKYGHVVVEYILSDELLKDKIISVAETVVTVEDVYSIPVKNVKDLREYSQDKDTLVVVAVAEDKQCEILNTLHELGFCNIFRMNIKLFASMERWSKRRKQLQNIANGTNIVEGKMNDILWGMNFDRIISQSEWLKKRDFSPGRSAVNNMYLYLMYKILDSKKFHSILDIGMGQTTKMVGQYVNYDTAASHTIIEDNCEWIEFCGSTLDLGLRSSIVQMDYAIRAFRGESVRVYEGFKKKLQGKKFDYISIDAPIGFDMKNYSRIDILDILPECLAESWIIMMDDVERMGEYNTLDMIRDVLEENNIAYAEQEYWGGEKSFLIMTSLDNRFFCTI